MLSKQHAVVGQRVKWVSPEKGGEVRYGAISEIIDGIECIIDYDDGGKGIAFVGNELSSVHPAEGGSQ